MISVVDVIILSPAVNRNDVTLCACCVLSENSLRQPLLSDVPG